jgi:hypothetical protein
MGSRMAGELGRTLLDTAWTLITLATEHVAEIDTTRSDYDAREAIRIV